MSTSEISGAITRLSRTEKKAFVIMKAIQQHNRAILIKAAELLRPLQENFVFLSGMALTLLVSDPAAPDVRPTEDVDVVVEAATYLKYSQLEERLRAQGFTQPREEKNVICRWARDDVLLDIMPVDQTILSFGNRWYSYAVESAQIVSLLPSLSIRLISAPCFLATKIEAFRNGRSVALLRGRDPDPPPPYPLANVSNCSIKLCFCLNQAALFQRDEGAVAENDMVE